MGYYVPEIQGIPYPGGNFMPQNQFGLYPRGNFMPEIRFRLYPRGGNYPLNSGRLLHGGVNLARVSVHTFARWGKSSPEFWQTLPRWGMICQRFQAEFCKGCKTFPKIWFIFLQGMQ